MPALDKFKLEILTLRIFSGSFDNNGVKESEYSRAGFDVGY